MTLAPAVRCGSLPAHGRRRLCLACGPRARLTAAAESPRCAPPHGPDSAESISADRDRRRGGQSGRTRSDASAGHIPATMLARPPCIPDSARPCLRRRSRPWPRSQSRTRAPAPPARRRALRAAPRAASCSPGPSVRALHGRSRYGVPLRTQLAANRASCELDGTFCSQIARIGQTADQRDSERRVDGGALS